jgi:hypothetical protein
MATTPLTALFAVACMAAAHAQEPPREATVTTEELAPDLHVLYGSGGGQVSGNVLALTSSQGRLSHARDQHALARRSLGRQ